MQTSALNARADCDSFFELLPLNLARRFAILWPDAFQCQQWYSLALKADIHNSGFVHVGTSRTPQITAWTKADVKRWFRNAVFCRRVIVWIPGLNERAARRRWSAEFAFHKLFADDEVFLINPTRGSLALIHPRLRTVTLRQQTSGYLPFEFRELLQRLEDVETLTLPARHFFDHGNWAQQLLAWMRVKKRKLKFVRLLFLMPVGFPDQDLLGYISTQSKAMNHRDFPYHIQFAVRTPTTQEMSSALQAILPNKFIAFSVQE